MSDLEDTAAATCSHGGAFHEHDHDVCAADALARAEKICLARSARLTPIRRRVLELLWESHQPIGAYELLDRLKAAGMSAQPPAVYRALDFLIAHGLAHKIESASAYIGCATANSETACAAHFVICRSCGRAAELTDAALDTALNAAAARIGFASEHVTLEIAGLCAACATP
ncbi:MAG: transcriptional repressor [Neomegalonema sp.]|nr:transcriptional repressor [Neomegalonema sp.]